MRKSDLEAMTPGQQWRLRIALDRVMPAFSPPRYQTARTSVVRTWRLAPVTLVIGITGVLAMSAYAATGSPNPAVWGQRAESTIQSVRRAPEVSPTPPSSAPANAGLPGTTAKSKSAAPLPEPTETQSHDRYGQPRESPDSRGNGGENPPSPSPSPSPSPRPSPSPSPSPTPSPHGD